MEGYTGQEAAQTCHLHRQSVTTYIKKCNEGGLFTLHDWNGNLELNAHIFNRRTTIGTEKVSVNEFSVGPRIRKRHFMNDTDYLGIICTARIRLR
jgi:hypothetical protein